ncbi:MAG: YciI family protein [Candidatus Velthaea sp.]|jgi:hypothetical protein
MSEYLYIYRGGESERSPEEAEKQMQLWTAWLSDLGQKGHIKDPGQPLEHTGKVVTGKAKMLTDGPYAEAKDLVGGYTIVEAKDLGEATELSSGCPILTVGGSVEIRPVMKM